MNKDLTRLEKIKQERKELLTKVKETLNNNKNEYSDTLSQIIMFINQDEKSIKRYEALTKSQDLIATLIMEVLKSENEEDIIKLRNKINYLINKVKKELKSRNINASEMATYEEKTKYMRKSMSNYIRFLRRNKNIAEIEGLLANYDSLSLDEMKKLKKLLKNEKSYNTNHKKKQTINALSKKKESLKDIKDIFLSAPHQEKTNLQDVNAISVSFMTKEKPQSININEAFLSIPNDNLSESQLLDIDNMLPNFNSKKENHQFTTSSNVEFQSIRSDLLERANMYKQKYGIRELHEYNSSFIYNLFNLLRNIPEYIINKKRIKAMEIDTHIFYKGSDLISYIAYTKKRNSILTGLKSVFSKSYLYNGEGRYLNMHNNCSRWLYNYCESKELPVKVLTLN